jgi:hypothetical protein
MTFAFTDQDQSIESIVLVNNDVNKMPLPVLTKVFVTQMKFVGKEQRKDKDNEQILCYIINFDESSS